MDLDKDVILPLLQPIILSTAILDISAAAQDLITTQNSEPQIEKLSLKHTPKSDHKSPAEIELEKIETRLRTVQLSLEILTGVCATLPDPEYELVGEEIEEDGDLEEGTFSHSQDIAWMCDSPVEIGIGGDMDVEIDGIDYDRSPIPAFIVSLVNPLLALIQPCSLSFPPLAAPSPHPPTTSALSAVHVSALECLNNIFLSIATSRRSELAMDAVSGMKFWNDIWCALTVVGTQMGLGQERRQEVWEKAVGVLWGIGNVWKGSLVGRSTLRGHK